MDEIAVSIICITYNQAKYIRDALEGFLMQRTSFAYEILVHDDVSTDGTIDILKEYQKKYPDKIRLLLEEENQYSKGVDILNDICIPQARGKYIACCEGDDYWIYFGKLQAQYDLMETHEEISLCYHNAVQYNEDKDKLTLSVGKHTSGYIKDPDIICPRKGWYPTASIFCRKEDMLKYPDWHEPTGDEGIRCHMACCGRLYYINQAWCFYRDRSKGSWNSKFEQDEEVAIKYIRDAIIFQREFNQYSHGKYEKYFYERIKRSVLWYIFAHDNDRSEWHTLEQFRSYMEKMKIATEHKADELMDRICAIEAIRCTDYYWETVRKNFPNGFDGRQIYLYGAGIEATKAVAALALSNINIGGLVVSDKAKNTKRIFDYPIYGIDELDPNGDMVIWPCMFLERESIINSLQDRGFKYIII